MAERVAVLGAGTMAPGIATSFAAAGHSVRLWARKPAAGAAALRSAQAATEFLAGEGLASPGGPHLIRFIGDLAGALEGADLVVEAIAEDLTQKRNLFVRVERLVDSGCILASNTSGLPVDDIAAGVRDPGRVLALHFWNPAHLMPLVEVAGGKKTAPEVIERAQEIVRGIGKRPIRLQRTVLGFIGTRLQQALVREAIALLREGVADASEIDATVRLALGTRFPVLGPLELSDLGGLDVIAAIHDYLLSDLASSGEPDPLLLEMVAAGHLGAKSGRGFYDWSLRDANELRAARDAELLRQVKALRAN